ncbi:CHAT domain-containing protein [Boletus coccyginus]|nr:CHAT domain-containing protein [Boletus coccyginus]
MMLKVSEIVEVSRFQFTQVPQHFSFVANHDIELRTSSCGLAHMSSNVLRLHSQAGYLLSLFQRGGGIHCLDASIVLDREALKLCPLEHPNRSQSLNSLAYSLYYRYNEFGTMRNLDEAIELSRKALDLCPPGSLHRPPTLIYLSRYLSTRYIRLGRMKDLDEGIVRGREALKLCPPGNTFRSESLDVLSISLSTRYDQLGVMENLDEAIVLGREALKLCPSGDPHRSSYLVDLAVHLSSRYHQLGEMNDLDDGIVLGREALELSPHNDPNRPRSLNNLACDLSNRYERLGEMKDLEEAIVLGREALKLLPPKNPDRWQPLMSLSARLTKRCTHLRVIDDLREAIILDGEALELCPPESPGRSKTLTSLAVDFSSLYDLTGEMGALDKAIVLGREALALCPPGHPGRPTSLSNLAARLTTRYRGVQVGEIQDLNDATALYQEALGLLPPGHPDQSQLLNNLAIHFATRYDQLKKAEDLDRAVALNREALERCPFGHPNRTYSLDCLASTLCSRFRQIGDVDGREELFSLYAELAHVSQTVSTVGLTAARSWVRAAEEFQHPTILEAYRTSLQLLVQHLATLPSLPQNLSLLKALASSLAVDAFSAYVRHRSPTDAVELLEQGRGVFWSQLSRLRSPLDDVIASGQAGKKLADEFIQLTSNIRNILSSPDTAVHDRVWRLNLQLEKVVTDIRGLSGLSRFLLPPLFSDFQQAASEGPVIIVNASEYSCDALIVLLDRDPVHIPLSITIKYVRELSSRLRDLTRRARSGNVARDLGLILRELWDDVVSPIVDYLQKIYPSRSRIWWCPTAEFSLLPLHAAGPYRKGQKNLADLYISSHTPTLTALIRARQRDSPNSAAEQKRFIAIGQANAPGESELPSVSAELASIAQLVDGLATFTRIEGEEATISRASEELGKNQWIHLACHGLPNSKRPFESAFALADGHFTIQKIIQCEPENPQFAYLSACHTTVGDKDSPDEVIHLASAIQFAGFRSVIGTMWAVDDGETKKITQTFYANMKDESGRLDHTRAAFALDKTMRSVDIPLDQRVLYIHIGA